MNNTDNKVLLVSHDLSLTGAPLALIGVAKALSNMGKTVTVVSPVDGFLHEMAEKEHITVIITSMLSYEMMRLVQESELVIANTILCGQLIHALNFTDINVMWWIHEGKSYSREMQSVLPQQLGENIKIFAPGKYTSEIIKSYRPQYNVGIFYYALSDYLNIKEYATLPHTIENKIVFSTVGMIDRRKGIDILIRAVDLLPKQIQDNCVFLIIGHVNDQGLYKQIEDAQELHPQNIVYMSAMPHDQIMSIINKTDVLICSSRDDPMPTVVTEAEMMCKPIICSANTGSASVIQEYNAGLVYNDDSPEQLANLIAEMYLMKPSSRKQLGENGRKIYDDKFAPSIFFDALQEILLSFNNLSQHSLTEKQIDCWNLMVELQEMRVREEKLMMRLKESENRELEARRELAEVFNSNSWKLTKICRTVGKSLRNR